MPILSHHRHHAKPVICMIMCRFCDINCSPLPAMEPILICVNQLGIEGNTDFKLEVILYLTSKSPGKPRFREDQFNVIKVAVRVV